MMIKAKSVRLYGQAFRSTLEAQYAAFFTVAGIEWEYEPVWGEYEPTPSGWLPDFLIDWGGGDRCCFVEVKPHLNEARLRNVIRKIDRALPAPSSPTVTGPWVWITSGGLGHLGTDAEGIPVTRVGKGAQRNGNNHEWEDADLEQLLWLPDDGEVAPFGSLQLGFLWGKGNQLEFEVDEEPWWRLLPVGCKSWGDVWRKAVKIMSENAEPCDAPPNPREWLDERGSDECPECGGDKTPGFMRCRNCAYDNYL